MKPLTFLFLAFCIVLGNAKDSNMFVASGSDTWVIGPDMPSGGPAVGTYKDNPGWGEVLPGSEWIWDSPYVSSPQTTQICYFIHDFVIPGNVSLGQLWISADNLCQIFINGNKLSCDADNTWGEPKICDISEVLQAGENQLSVMVTNFGTFGSNYGSNPAGLMYLILIDYSEPK